MTLSLAKVEIVCKTFLGPKEVEHGCDVNFLRNLLAALLVWDDIATSHRWSWVTRCCPSVEVCLVQRTLHCRICGDIDDC